MLRNRLAKRVALALVTAGAVIGSIVVVAAAPAQAAPCSTYYVSSASGSDSNDGCSSATPWQTLANVNATTFAAGNQILFQDGGAWSGELHPLGSGATGNPIIVSNYGTGATPVINGGGAAATIDLDNQQFWTVQNLEITNSTPPKSVRAGILVENDTSGILSGITIQNMNIHDVLGYWDTTMQQPSQDSGISFNLSDSFTTNGWNGITIQNNTMNHVDAGGIYIGSIVGLNHSISTSNVVIQNNTMNDLGGNDVVCVFCSSPLVQNNVATNSGYRYGGAGFWMAVNSNGTWQNNEISRQWIIKDDGTAFDVDHDNSNVIVQYNYTHDNPAGSFEFCCSSSFGATSTIIRDNISQNDGTLNGVYSKLYGVTTTGTTQFYNNTVYEGQNNNAAITNGVATGHNITFSNNLIYKLGTGGYASGATWTHNLFYGNHPTSEPSDAAKVTTDPLLVAPGSAGSGITTASAYELLGGSPAIGAGAVIASNGGSDFFGNPVSATAAPNIGAYNGAGTTLPAATPGAYYDFNEGTGTRAPDVWNHANTGTLQPGASWTTGKVGPYALALSGASNSYVDVPTTAVDTSGSYSVAAWVELNSLTGNQTFASIDGSNISPFYLQLTAGKLAFSLRGSDSTSAALTSITGATVSTGTWYHVIGVYDASAHTASLYVNGVLAASTSFSSAWKANGHTTIGRAKWNGGNVDFVNGNIDDVRFYPTAITKNQAFALGTGASGYFQFDENAGTATSDFITGAPQGALYGDAGWAAGKVGASSISVDGTTNTSVDLDANPVDTGKSYSATAWVKFNSTSGGQTFLSEDGHTVSGFYLQLAGGHLAYTVRSSDSTSSTATTITGPAVTAGTWYHVVGTFDAASGTLSLYVNGALSGTAAFSTPWTASGETEVGRALWNKLSVDWTNAQVDDAHFYQRALSATEVSALYAL